MMHEVPPIVIDTREQTPLVFPSGVATVRGTLRTGDYSVAGHEAAFTVERKSLADLVNTVIHERERFERELERMAAFAFRRLLIVAPFREVARGGYRFSRANPAAVLASVATFEVRYGVPAVFAHDAGEAAALIVLWARYFDREARQAARP